MITKVDSLPLTSLTISPGRFSPHLLAAAVAASGAATAATNGTFPHTVPRQGDKCALQVSPRVLAAAVVAEGSQARIRSIRESRVPLQEALYCRHVLIFFFSNSVLHASFTTPPNTPSSALRFYLLDSHTVYNDWL